MEQAAIYITIAFGLWLIAASLLMLLAPRKALLGLSKMGSTNLINYGEITLRFIAGVGLFLSSPASAYPQIFYIAGAFIMFSSGVLYLIPKRWHAAYAVWWSQKIPPLAVRLMAQFSLVVGYLTIASFTW